jgi:hypothetical protein
MPNLRSSQLNNLSSRNNSSKLARQPCRFFIDPP